MRPTLFVSQLTLFWDFQPFCHSAFDRKTFFSHFLSFVFLLFPSTVSFFCLSFVFIHVLYVFISVSVLLISQTSICQVDKNLLNFYPYYEYFKKKSISFFLSFFLFLFWCVLDQSHFHWTMVAIVLRGASLLKFTKIVKLVLTSFLRM